MKNTFSSEQIWDLLKKKSKESFIESVLDSDSLLYLPECDKIIDNDFNRFYQLLLDLTSHTKRLKIILTTSKILKTQFISYQLKDFTNIDTRIFLQNLLKNQKISDNERKSLEEKFISNDKIPRSPYNIQSFAKNHDFSGVELREDIKLDDIQKDKENFKILCLLSFFKIGLSEVDFKILANQQLISNDWLERLRQIIIILQKNHGEQKIFSKQIQGEQIMQNLEESCSMKVKQFSDLINIIDGEYFIMTDNMLQIDSTELILALKEYATINYEAQICCLYLFASVVQTREIEIEKKEYKALKLIDYSWYSPNKEVFQDIIPKPTIPIQRKTDLLPTNYQTLDVAKSIIAKSQLINENLTPEQIDQIFQLFLSFYFYLISNIKLYIFRKNYLLKQLINFGITLFEKYIQLSQEKKLIRVAQIQKAKIYLRLLLLDVEINDKKTCFQFKQILEEIEFLMEIIKGTDFQKVIESQLHQTKAYLYLLYNQRESIENKMKKVETSEFLNSERLKDQEIILNALEMSKQCISNEKNLPQQQHAYYELNGLIRLKNEIFRIETKLVFDFANITQNDQNTFKQLQKTIQSMKYNNNITIIYQMILNQIQFQIYKKRIMEGYPNSLYSLTNLIQQDYPQLKNEENFYGQNKINQFQMLVANYKEECQEGLIYIMHSQPIQEVIDPSDNHCTTSSSDSKKDKFRYLNQPQYNSWNYNEILRSQVFKKSLKAIKYSFLQFTRKNYEIATCSGCQILSINSNFEEDFQLKSFQFEGSRMMEVDINKGEQRKIQEKMQQIQRVQILFLNVNNSVSLKEALCESFVIGQPQPVIFYFPFKRNCSAFDKVLICQKFQLEFLKHYLNLNNSIEESFLKAKESLLQFILKKCDLQREENISFEAMLREVPQIYSSSQISDVYCNPKLPQQWQSVEITPLINHSILFHHVDIDMFVMKVNDFSQLMKFFNDPEVKLVNLYDPPNSTKVGKLTLALSFGIKLLERNLLFLGGIYFVQNKHNSQHSPQEKKNRLNNTTSKMASSLQLSQSMSLRSQVSTLSHNESVNYELSDTNSQFCLSLPNFQHSQSYTILPQQSTINNTLKQILENLHPQPSNNKSNSRNIKILIILKDFDSNEILELLSDRKFSNYRFLNISSTKLNFRNNHISYSIKNHKVVDYKIILNTIIKDIGKLENDGKDAHRKQNKLTNTSSTSPNLSSNKKTGKQQFKEKSNPDKKTPISNIDNNNMINPLNLSTKPLCSVTLNKINPPKTPIQKDIQYYFPKTTFLLSLQ